MNKELLITAAQAAYGTNFVTPISRELQVTDRSVRRWIDGTYPTPALEIELIAILKKRNAEIENAINTLKGSIKMTTITIPREVPESTVQKIQQLLDEVAIRDVNWNGVTFEITRGDFTEISGEETTESIKLYRQINEIIIGY